MAAISVVIPTHNRAGLLTAAIDSVRRASSNAEIIVVDDASTDHTPEVCKGLSGVRYLRLPENRGLAQARNAGILASSEELVAFLDDDDLRLPGSLAAQRQQLDAAPDAAFCYGRLLAADAVNQLPTGDVIPKHCPTGDVFWDLLEQNFISPISVLARKNILVDIGMFRSGLGGVEDWDLWLRVTERWPVIAAKDPVAIYRRANLSSGQMCSDSVSMYRHMFRVQESALQLPRAAAAASAKRRRARSRLLTMAYNAMVYEAKTALAEGDGETVRAKSREALRLRPFRGRADLNLRRLLRTV